MQIKIGDTVYVVIEKVKDEVCILVNVPFADGTTRQLRTWTDKYEEFIDPEIDVNNE